MRIKNNSDSLIQLFKKRKQLYGGVLKRNSSEKLYKAQMKIPAEAAT